jgi:hypothetical protein
MNSPINTLIKGTETYNTAQANAFATN